MFIKDINNLLNDLRLLKKYNVNTYIYLTEFLYKFIDNYVKHGSYQNNKQWRAEIIAENENFHYTINNKTFPCAIILIATFYDLDIKDIIKFTKPYILEALF